MVKVIKIVLSILLIRYSSYNDKKKNLHVQYFKLNTIILIFPFPFITATCFFFLNVFNFKEMKKFPDFYESSFQKDTFLTSSREKILNYKKQSSS